VVSCMLEVTKEMFPLRRNSNSNPIPIPCFSYGEVGGLGDESHPCGTQWSEEDTVGEDGIMSEMIRM
jgi:hypothetical protein